MPQGAELQVIKDEPRVPAAITPAQMIELAIKNNAGVETMERLLSLQARYDAMQAKKAFDNAMAELRVNMPTIFKSQEVDFTTNRGRTHYRYEDLSAVTKALSPIMSELGLSFRWRTSSDANSVTVTCIITHREGHAEETTLSAPMDTSGNKNPIQAIGSATTYLQRYTLKAAVGVAAAYDDDGQSAAATPPIPDEGVKRASKAQSRETYSRLSEANRKLATEADFNKFWSQQSVLDAVNTMPLDWQMRLSYEKDDKAAELHERAQKQAGIDPTDSLNHQFGEAVE